MNINLVQENFLLIKTALIALLVKTHYGGCFSEFLESVLRFGRLKCHFLALENGHFWQ